MSKDFDTVESRVERSTFSPMTSDPRSGKFPVFSHFLQISSNRLWQLFCGLGIFLFMHSNPSTERLNHETPGRDIRSAIESARAIIESGKIDWPALLADGEWIAMKTEREPDLARHQEQLQRHLHLD